eukprot:1149439-Pelagomonas_calceolata.AAC.5
MPPSIFLEPTFGLAAPQDMLLPWLSCATGHVPQVVYHRTCCCLGLAVPRVMYHRSCTTGHVMLLPKPSGFYQTEAMITGELVGLIASSLLLAL